MSSLNWQRHKVCLSQSDVRHLATQKLHSVRYSQYNFVLLSSRIPHNRILTARNQVRYFVYFGTAGIETNILNGTVVPSECFVVLQDSFHSLTVIY